MVISLTTVVGMIAICAEPIQAQKLRGLSQAAFYNLLGATEDGAGLVLGGEKGYLQLLSRGTNNPLVKIVTKDGREQAMKP